MEIKKVKEIKESKLKKVLNIYYGSYLASRIIGLIYIAAYTNRVEDAGYEFKVDNRLELDKSLVKIVSAIPIINIIVSALESSILLTDKIDDVVVELLEDGEIREKNSRNYRNYSKENKNLSLKNMYQDLHKNE